MAALQGLALANTIGNVVERYGFQDNNTGFNPLSLVAAPKPAPTNAARFEI